MKKEISLEIRNEISSVYNAIKTAREHIIDYIKQVVCEEGTIIFDEDNIEESIIINNDVDGHVCSVFKRTYEYETETGERKEGVNYFVESEYDEIDIELLYFDDIVALAEAIEFHLTGIHRDEDE